MDMFHRGSRDFDARLCIMVGFVTNYMPCDSSLDKMSPLSLGYRYMWDVVTGKMMMGPGYLSKSSVFYFII